MDKLKRIIKGVILLFLITVIASCGKKQKDKFDEGVYCLKSYLDKDNFESRYIEYFLIKVTKDKIIQYGTVNTWGNVSKRKTDTERKSIINDSTITDSTYTGLRGDGLSNEEFIKLKNADKIIDDQGINIEEFAKYLNKALIAGNYRLGKEIVRFSEDGKIENLDTLNTFSVYPRFGTLWWYDYRTMKINNEVWKFEFTNDNLILTKYLKWDEFKEEPVKLSNIKIILDR